MVVTPTKRPSALTSTADTLCGCKNAPCRHASGTLLALTGIPIWIVLITSAAEGRAADFPSGSAARDACTARTIAGRQAPIDRMLRICDILGQPHVCGWERVSRESDTWDCCTIVGRRSRACSPNPTPSIAPDGLVL